MSKDKKDNKDKDIEKEFKSKDNKDNKDAKDKDKDKDTKEIEKEFNNYAKKVKDLKSRPSDADLLVLYGLYKQSNDGDCDISQPWVVQLEARAKWEAWNEHKGMEKLKAMKKYVKKAKELIEKDK